jgi:hypothetical protein
LRKSPAAPPPPPTNFGEQKFLFRHLAIYESAPRAIYIDAVASSAVSIDFTAISTNLVVSYDEEEVVLPRG